MSEIGKGFRRGAKALLDFSTQQRLLEREKSQRLAEKQDADTRSAMLKLTALNTPAGVAATRGILGDTFDPAQELDYRRMQSLLKPSLDAEQYGILNPLAAKIGLQGQFKPSELTEAKTATERSRQARIEQQRKDDEKNNSYRRTKIAKDIELTNAHLAETLSGLYDDGIAKKAGPDRVLQTVDVIDRVVKGYSEHLKSLRGMPDFERINPKYADEYEDLSEKEQLAFRLGHPDFILTNERYADQVQSLEKSQNEALAVRSRLLNALIDKSKEAQQLDAASGGQIAGNAGANIQQQMAMELIKRNYPELYKQLRQQEFQKSLQFVNPPPQTNGRQFEFVRPPQSNSPIIRTPDGLQWRFENGKYIQVR